MNKSNIINLGLIGAAISIVMFLLMAIIDGGWVFLTSILIVSIAITVILAVVFVKRQRRENAGFISFKDAFMLVFLGLAIAGAISTAFSIVYTQFIDTDFAERSTYKSLEMTKGFMEGRVADEQMEQTLREVEEKTMAQYSPLGFIKSYGIGLIFYAVLAAIVAAIMKRNPEYVRTETSGEILDN